MVKNLRPILELSGILGLVGVLGPIGPKNQDPKGEVQYDDAKQNSWNSNEDGITQSGGVFRREHKVPHLTSRLAISIERHILEQLDVLIPGELGGVTENVAGRYI